MVPALGTLIEPTTLLVSVEYELLVGIVILDVGIDRPPSTGLVVGDTPRIVNAADAYPLATDGFGQLDVVG